MCTCFSTFHFLRVFVCVLVCLYVLVNIVCCQWVYTAVSKKVAPVIHDAWCLFHSLQCIMGASLVWNMRASYSENFLFPSWNFCSQKDLQAMKHGSCITGATFFETAVFIGRQCRNIVKLIKPFNTAGRYWKLVQTWLRLILIAVVEYLVEPSDDT